MRKLQISKEQNDALIAVTESTLARGKEALATFQNAPVDADANITYEETVLLPALRYLGEKSFNEVAAVLSAFKATPIVEPEVATTPEETSLKPSKSKVSKKAKKTNKK